MAFRDIRIGLDWDGTVSLNEEMWFEVVKVMQDHGNQVYIVTMSYPSECGKISPAWYELVKHRVICTSRKAKKKFVEDLGLTMHIWIDDNPLALYLDAQQAFGVADKEGVVRDNYNYQMSVEAIQNGG